jgi:hypothetical protein
VSRQEQYALTVERDPGGRILALQVDAVDLEEAARHVRVNGTKAERVAGPLHDLLRDAGVRGRTWTGPKPIVLGQVAGAQAELLLAAVKPLRRGDRIDAVAEAIAAMSREEASYWHAKSRRPGGLRALRVLLTEGGR